MLDHIRLHDVLFIDIECVSEKKDFKELPEEIQDLWKIKHDHLRIDDQLPAETYYERAGIFAEFGKIICISIGYIPPVAEGAPMMLRIKSYFGDDEKELLKDFKELLDTHFAAVDKFVICGHNIKEFDVPYICRRMIINQIELPSLLNLHGKKPWEVNHLDTLHLWRFGDYKSYSSLNMLAILLKVPTSKDDIAGKDVGRVYWEERDLQRIAIYCQKDVLVVAQLIMRFKGLPLLDTNNIEFV